MPSVALGSFLHAIDETMTCVEPAGGDYGFVSCTETAGYYGRDVRLGLTGGGERHLRYVGKTILENAFKGEVSRAGGRLREIGKLFNRNARKCAAVGRWCY